MTGDWLSTLKRFVEDRPCAVLKLDDDDWEQLANSRRGLSEFTIARRHASWANIRVPTLCTIFGSDTTGHHALVGIASSKAAVTTLETRVKVKRALEIHPSTSAELVALIPTRLHANNLEGRLNAERSVVALSPKLSAALVDALASIDANRGKLRMLAESLTMPRRYEGNGALQADAVHTALNIFGLAGDEPATRVELVANRDTALARVWIMEDSVIEHDARRVPEYELVESDLTGRAVFEHGGERLEVITANRRPLEEVFGVDLIYLNLTRENVVMVQYKMLESSQNSNGETDWIYRPDAKLDEEIARMERFVASPPSIPRQYRLNPEVFFLKFVKRDGAVKNGGIITPLQQYRRLSKDSSCIGPRGGLRISYNALQGRYLRQNVFGDLVRSGYIGAHAEISQQLVSLVRDVLSDGNAVIAAIQTRLERHDDASEDNGVETYEEF